jgi:hypothetical protein
MWALVCYNPSRHEAGSSPTVPPPLPARHFTVLREAAVRKRVPIKLNVANALQWLGTLYRNPADAVKEHISNAIDEHLKALEQGVAQPVCRVSFHLARKSVQVHYPYGMDRGEFEQALHRVADSAKRRSKAPQIGRLGIGIFSFQQIGRKCTFLSRKHDEDETLKVILREGSPDAEFRGALKKESLAAPGQRIIISELKLDPTKPRGPLDPARLRRVFAERFDSHLRRGWLEIEVVKNGRRHIVEPSVIDLPRIAAGLDWLTVPGRPEQRLGLELYFDPSGKGRVNIRHTGVVIVDDLSTLEAYGLEEGTYASGYVKGFLDADFLQPLPARSGFEDNEDWIGFLSLLDRHRPQIEAEVEQKLEAEQERELSAVQKRAMKLAREILDLDEFNDLELPGGLVKRRRGSTHADRKARKLEKSGQLRMPDSPPREPGDRPAPRGPRMNYMEIAFEDGGRLHSRFGDGVVQVNTLNRDYRDHMKGAPKDKLAYAALMIGKETVAYNDKTGAVDEFLEKFLSYYFYLKRRTTSSRARSAGATGASRKAGGRPVPGPSPEPRS